MLQERDYQEALEQYLIRAYISLEKLDVPQQNTKAIL